MQVGLVLDGGSPLVLWIGGRKRLLAADVVGPTLLRVNCSEREREAFSRRVAEVIGLGFVVLDLAAGIERHVDLVLLASPRVDDLASGNFLHEAAVEHEIVQRVDVACAGLVIGLDHFAEVTAADVAELVVRVQLLDLGLGVAPVAFARTSATGAVVVIIAVAACHFAGEQPA